MLVTAVTRMYYNSKTVSLKAEQCIIGNNSHLVVRVFDSLRHHAILNADDVTSLAQICDWIRADHALYMNETVYIT